ncbi:NADH dehydrogenase [ubiquinone] 1 beta subcomplex subunit 8, mitochondrial [Pseudomyrmex gracilis]|uniref:NADH dehydrogenase [ubiquinone] 1 beta subcomplex subunit 8, mitochondrial n=1 Tax=Pseudomyrmex gracilis TaxID=219809 RepID=UPI0009957FC0|nr:NADH dehydrogenase [ubiquinone] 1 beta subcomplex subunit 8, mitochondrial [Pseudomyrmex gracilis]
MAAMAVARLGGLSSRLLRKNTECLYSATRCYSDTPLPWNYVWRPKKYEEKNHEKIAEKYNLHPKEYKPYPPENCTGDYPDLPMIGPAAKDPYYPYDIPTLRKNYHEPLHYNFETMGEDRYSYGYPYRYDPAFGALCFVLFVAAYIGLVYLFEPYPTVHPRLEQQFPGKGVHYTFEPASKN